MNRLRLALPLAPLALAATSCGGGGTGDAQAVALASSGNGVGTTRTAASVAASTADRVVLTDPNRGGVATRLALEDVRYGRSVELWSARPDGSRTMVAREFVIGPDYTGDGVVARIEQQPVLGIARLVVHEDVDDLALGGRRRFLDAAAQASATTLPLSDAGLDGSGTLTEVPRNAALELRFSDLVDVSSLIQAAPRVLVGDPAIVPFELRTMASEIHGGVSSATGEFAPTRLVLGLATRELDAIRAGSLVPVNPMGLPAAAIGGGANAQLRLATAGPMIQNLSGAPLVPTGSVDLGSGSRDIVRPFRAGSDDGLYRGFLSDDEAPRLIASATTTILDAPQQSLVDPLLFVIPRVRFDAPGCAGRASVGDLIRQPGVVAEVDSAGMDPTGAILRDVSVRLIEFPAAWPGPEQFAIDGVGAATYEAPYEPQMDDTRVACLVDVTPTPLGFPTAPTRGISPSSTFTLHFNEPLGPDSVDGLEAAVLGRVAISAMDDIHPAEAVPSDVRLAAGGEAIETVPLLPLRHEQGEATRYWITPRLGVDSARDLAGNRLKDSPGPIAMVMNTLAPSHATDGRLWTFASLDQDGIPGNDWAGQMAVQPIDERVSARPVVRSRFVVDRFQPILAQMIPFAPGVSTPLNPFGAKMQTVWRYADMGLSLTDPATTNIDVEGLLWSPAGGGVVADAFDEFEIQLAHSRFAPDEILSPTSLFPQFPNSGLRPQFDVNGLAGEEPTVVHPREQGYVIQPGDLEQTVNGTLVLPFPQNQDPSEPRRLYTWRDTEIRERGGPANGGVEPHAYLLSLGVPIPDTPYYSAGEVQTLGLPLLMEFSTWPDAGGVGANSFDINLAVNTSTRPYFRAFSAGGIDQNGTAVFVDPSLEAQANGGFNAGSVPPGAPTFGRDNSVHLGAADFVVRKSIAHSVWIDAGSDSATREFFAPIVGPGDQPAGTTVRVDARLALDVSVGMDNDQDGNGLVDYLEDAAQLDLYGDYYAPLPGGGVNHDSQRANPGLGFFAPAPGAVDDWRSDLNGLIGARYVQLRIAFESNVETGVRPTVSGLGIAWRD